MTTRRVVLPLFAAVCLFGCSKSDRADGTKKTSAPPTNAAASQEYNPTNTGRNKRDRDGDTVTAGDQSESSGDLKITQNVRKALIADKELSLNAHNVKVIAKDGTVTLRGPVDSAGEKSAVVAKAEQVAGATKVVDELEVKRR